MKFDFIRIIIAICIATLLGWLFYALSDGDAQLPLGIVAGVDTLLLLGCTIGMSIPEYPRSTVMMRTACVSGWVVSLIVNAIYSFTGVNSSFYIVNGILVLLVLLIADVIYRSKQ